MAALRFPSTRLHAGQPSPCHFPNDRAFLPRAQRLRSLRDLRNLQNRVVSRTNFIICLCHLARSITSMSYSQCLMLKLFADSVLRRLSFLKLRERRSIQTSLKEAHQNQARPSILAITKRPRLLQQGNRRQIRSQDLERCRKEGFREAV